MGLIIALAILEDILFKSYRARVAHCNIGSYMAFDLTESQALITANFALQFSADATDSSSGFLYNLLCCAT